MHVEILLLSAEQLADVSFTKTTIKADSPAALHFLSNLFLLPVLSPELSRFHCRTEQPEDAP